MLEKFHGEGDRGIGILECDAPEPEEGLLGVIPFDRLFLSRFVVQKLRERFEGIADILRALRVEPQGQPNIGRANGRAVANEGVFADHREHVS